MLLACKSIFLRRGNDVAILYKAGRAVMVKS
jgi:hypothetical protein